MQDLQKPTAKTTEAHVVKTVTVFIQSNIIILQGNWKWQLNSDAVFCSDVMTSAPQFFEGTTGIIHPDDLSFLKELIRKEEKNPDPLEFRIITTYGEVKTLSCNRVRIEKKDEGTQVLQVDILRQPNDELQGKREYENLQLFKEIYENSERLTGTGIWYYNSVTNETWYSPQVFRIYNLPPQSLNAHLHTFTSFIHPEDKEQVIEFSDKAYKQRLPLHITYRINTTTGEKFVLSVTYWFFNAKGEEIMSGTLQDITEQRKWEQDMEEAAHSIGFYKQQLLLDEQQANIAHWQVDLLTRKTVYSGNIYRIYGVKPQAVPAGLNSFINYIHPEDRQLVAAANKKMIYEHKVPDLEYRIIRSDGKLRYISQKAKLVTYGGEMVIAGVIQDVTVQKMLEKKLMELTEKERVKHFISQGVEEMAGIVTWVWEVNTGEISWSESLYELLGYRPNTIKPAQKLLLAFIHPEDQKLFKDQQNLVLEQKQETVFDFRLIQRGTIKYMKAAFRLMQDKDANLFIATMRDISKEYLLQQQLKQRVQLAEALLENMLNRVIITDLSNNILAWNKECERVYGIAKEDAIGSNYFDVFPHLKTEEDLQLFNKVLKGEKIALQSRRSYSGKGFHNLHMLPLWDEEQSEATGVIQIIQDVTTEVELRQHLKERLNLISSLLEASVDRIIALDRNMNYLYWNKKAEEYYGLKKEDVVGKNILELFPGFINDPSYSEFRKALKGETVHLPAKAAPGGKEYFETYLIPIKDENNEVGGVLWMVHDLIKEYELQIRHTKEQEVLEALNENYLSMDGGYRVSYVNQNALDFFGKSEEEVLNKIIWEVFPKLIDTPLFDAMKKAMEEGVPTRDEFLSPSKGTWSYVSIAPTAEGIVVVFFDMQAIKEAQELIKEKHALLQNVLNSPNLGLVVYKAVRNEKNRIIDFEFVLVSGKTLPLKNRENLIGKRAFEIIPSAQSELDKLVNVVERGESYTSEFNYNENGNDQWFLTSNAPFGDGFINIWQDITDLKQTEQKLSRTLASFVLQNQIYEHAEVIANMGTWTWNPDSNEAHYSDNMFVLFGMKPQEVKPGFDTIPKFIHPDDRDRLLQVAANLKEGNTPVGTEYRIIRKDGVERIFRNRVKLIRNENGERLIIGTTQDITEETELRKQLIEGAQYAEKIIDASVNRIHAVNPAMEIIAWNKRSEEITGIKKEEAIGKKLFDLFPKLELDEIIRKAYEEAMAGKQVHLQPKKAIYSQVIYERFFIPLKNDSDETYAVVCILLDVSSLVQKEEELIELNKTLEHKNRELEQKNEEITSFAFVASHDLKEPLRKISTFSDWLLQKEPENLSERGKEYLTRMNKSVGRLSQLIDDILVLTKVHSDPNKIKEVPLNHILGLVMEDMDSIIRQKKAIIKVDELPVIYGNPNQLFYLFHNLLDNALKFQPEGQKPVVSITSELLPEAKEPGLKPGKDYLKLSFSDNGIGFDHRYKRKIFQVFQQLKESDTPFGTGMGLAICKKVMENHEGIITADSEKAKGSVFCCYFPF